MLANPGSWTHTHITSRSSKQLRAHEHLRERPGLTVASRLRRADTPAGGTSVEPLLLEQNHVLMQEDRHCKCQMHPNASLPGCPIWVSAELLTCTACHLEHCGSQLYRSGHCSRACIERCAKKILSGQRTFSAKPGMNT